VFTQVAAGCQPAATCVNTTRYRKYSQVLLMMGENIAPKNVEPAWNNKLIYIVHLVRYFHSWDHDAWIHERQVKKKSTFHHFSFFSF
jgi:hypothetical protein